MRTRDFERAIDALGDVTIDNMKLLRGQVRVCLAHSSKELLLFDAFGRAFSDNRPVDEPDAEMHQCLEEVDYEYRVPFYDLKFK